MYNSINHVVAETYGSRCWLATEMIFFLLLGRERDKVCTCFIDICFFAPGFGCFVKNYSCMYVFISEAKNFTVVDYFISFFCEVFSMIELFKEVRNWCGWIPTCSHAIEILCVVGGGDGSVLSV